MSLNRDQQAFDYQSLADANAAQDGTPGEDVSQTNAPTSLVNQVRDIAAVATNPHEYRGLAAAAGDEFMGSVVRGLHGLQVIATGANPFLSPEQKDAEFAQVADSPLMRSAAAYWTPDADTTGKAASAISKIVGVAGSIVGAAGQPEIMATGAAGDTGAQLVDQGATSKQATGIGIASGVSTELGMKVPILGNTLGTRMATGAAGFTAINTAATATEHAIAAGNPDLAKQYDPWDVGARITDLLSGAGFGGLHHMLTMATPAPSTVDAALTLNNAKSFQSDTAPGIPANATALATHQDAMEVALAQAHAGEPVEVAGKLQGAEFIQRPPQPQIPIPAEPAGTTNYTDFRRALESRGKADAVNPRSNAVGADQFIPSTWLATIKQAAPTWAHGLDDEQLLALRTDPVKSGEMAQALDAQNSAALEHAGQPVTNENLYAAHHFGAAKGVEFAQADGKTPVDQILSKAAMDANPYLRHDGIALTKDQVIANWERRAGEPTPQVPTVAAQAQPVSPILTAHLDGQKPSIGDTLQHRIDTDYEGVKTEYASMPETQGGTLLNADLARELSPEYRADRTLSSDVHEQASGFIKQRYAELLAEPTPAGKEPTVLFTAGGTGAGKSSGLRAMGDQLGRPEITYDTNMDGYSSAVTKIDQAIVAGRNVKILYVHSDPLAAFDRAVKRAKKMGRTVPLDAHQETHENVLPTMQRLAEHYEDDPRVKIIAVDNTAGPGEAFQAPLESMAPHPYNNLSEHLDAKLEEHRQAGLSEKLAAGFQRREAGQALGTVGSGDRAAVRGQPQSERAGGTPTADDYLAQIRKEIGWAERGGRIIRGGDIENSDNPQFQRPGGDVVGRTEWVDKLGPDGKPSPFWRMRPDPSLNEAQAHAVLDKMAAGAKLGAREQRFADYARNIAQSYADEHAQDRIDHRIDTEAERSDSVRAERAEHSAEVQDALGAAARIAAETPDHPVATVLDEHGQRQTVTAADEHASILDEHAAAIKDAESYQSAIDCYLRRG